MYINRRLKERGDIVYFINSMQLGSTIKQPNCIFEIHEGNCIFVCAIKSIHEGKELLIDYNLNHIDTKKDTIMGEVVHTMHILNQLQLMTPTHH